MTAAVHTAPDGHDRIKPDPACVLAMHNLVEKTSEATAKRVAELIGPLAGRVEHLEHAVRGNGTPGMIDEVRMLKQAHADSVAVRRMLVGFGLTHVVTLVAGVVAATLWVARVERYMDATSSQARVELAGRLPVVLDTDRGQVVIKPPEYAKPRE